MRVFNKKILFAAAAMICLSGGTAAHASQINENIVYEESGIEILETETDTVETGFEEGDAEVHRIAAIGSVSKVFCVTAAMQLAEQGKIDIDAPVTQYVKEFKMQDERYKDITVRMLMNHTSGLMGFMLGDNMLYDEVSTDAHDRFLDNLSRSRLKSDPGTMENYCNDGLTLLEIVVERVSGESFTDYVDNHICKPLDLESTGTCLKMYGSPNTARVLIQGNVPYATDYCVAFGSGGMMSTVDDMRIFGSTFFMGDERILSEESKKAMMKTDVTDPYEWWSGLGWDSVDFFGYAGIEDCPQVLFKGGSLDHQFAGLMVAPEEEISVAVTITGGDGTEATVLSQELMAAALEETGAECKDILPEEQVTLDKVPEKYMGLADIYACTGGIYRVDFPNGEYMELTELTADIPRAVRYKYTEADSFVKMVGEPGTDTFLQDPDQELLHFVERDGNTYITKYENVRYEGFRRFTNSGYMLQRVGEASVGEDVKKAWEERDGKKYYVTNMRYSNTVYDDPCLEVVIPEGETGYAKIKGLEKTFMLTDEDSGVGFLFMPGENGGRLEDFELVTEDGTQYLQTRNKTLKAISEEAIPDFTSDITEIELNSEHAQWYNVGDIAGKTVSFDIPEKASIYIYDNFGRLIYSSYMKDYGEYVTVPEEGKIMFAGENGGVIGVR